MADATNTHMTGELVPFRAEAATEPNGSPPHDSPFVTQLIASAWDWPNIPCRRRFERNHALGAYDTATQRQPGSRTRRVI